MLDRNKVRTAIIINAMLLMITAVNAAGNQPPSDSLKQAPAIGQLRFDSVMLQIHGLPDMTIAPAIKMNKKAEKFVEDYLQRNIETLDGIKSKSPTYFRVINEVFTKYQLPTELKYLAVIESELNTKARSKVGAVGTWQFMASTARIMSLKVNHKSDERTHLYKSTVAAARYLNDLYDIFGDWLLVIAAYNTGPGNVMKAIKKSGSRDFWKLQNFLPLETRLHVKKFIGTHYYFEGKGSVTTLTKQEVSNHKSAMMAFLVKQNTNTNTLLDEKEVAKATTSQPANETIPEVKLNGEMTAVHDEE
ncbi:MAG: lytic transglycosylase domain-containing protein [Chitinophagaceae bacterium]